MRIGEQPKQLRPGEVGTAFVLDIPSAGAKLFLGTIGPSGTHGPALIFEVGLFNRGEVTI